jgi:hypothetical protein
MLEETSHLAYAANPRAVQRELFVQQQARLEGNGTAFPKIDHPPPLSGGFQAQLPAGGAPRTVRAYLRAAAVGEIHYPLRHAFSARQDVHGASVLRQPEALGDQVYPYYLGPPEAASMTAPSPTGPRPTTRTLSRPETTARKIPC